MKYTDIDYFVFTDAARFISRGQSPYARDTYRYTPLLAWLIYPTTWSGTFWFSFGKVLFAVGDIVAGSMMYRILREHRGMEKERALKFASIWLLNPMVATISTRGSSEGLLGVFVTALLWAVLAKRMVLSGMLLGFAVHFKIYPFIYAASIVWWLDETKTREGNSLKARDQSSMLNQILAFITPQRIILAVSSIVTFAVLNAVMYQMYGWPFLEHSYFYHLSRIDHRHNFSPYNTLLYLNSSPTSSGSSASTFELERLAFLPQLLLSAIMIPLALARKDLPSTMLAQTFAFVTFNKVCTSQVSGVFSIAVETRLTSRSVLSVVHDVPTLLPARFDTPTIQGHWCYCACRVDCGAVGVATARVPARVQRSFHFCARTVAIQHRVFSGQRRDLGRHHS
jgi:phosphatidylinositol glycan class M